MDKPKTDWIAILVTCVVALFCTSMVLYAVAENRKSDNQYFKGRIASLEDRINQQDKRLDTLGENFTKINSDLRDLTTLTVQINANVIENSTRLENIVNPPRPPVKKGKPKSEVKPQRLDQPVIQGPRPEPPPPRKTPYAVEGKNSG